VSKGTVEYQDVILAITDISLRDGGFFITAYGEGPLAEYHGPARIIGPDGLLVQDGGHVDCPAATKDQLVWLEMTCTPSDPVAMP
jgi:hypothetical protein